MFENFLLQELTNRIGSQVEITLDNGSVEGILTATSTNFLTVSPVVAYGNPVNNPVFVAVASINGIEFPQGV